MSRIVAVSGGFDPLHEGHLALLKEAKELTDDVRLVVILNNDNWLDTKKGYHFYDEQVRKSILESIRYVDRVILSFHRKNDTRKDVALELNALRPDVFVNGGDRTISNTPEMQLCHELGIMCVFNIGGHKTASSSDLVDRVRGI